MTVGDNTAAMNLFLSRLGVDALDTHGKATVRCPAHDDRTPSLALRREGNRLLLHCFAGCKYDDILRAVGLTRANLREASEAPFSSPEGEEPIGPMLDPEDKFAHSAHEQSAHQQPRPGYVPHGSTVTLADLAVAKKLPADFLQSLGWRDNPAGLGVLIAYARRADGATVRERIRLRLRSSDKVSRFSWGDGDEMCAYDPDRGALARRTGVLFIVEGETDTATLLYNGFAAVGLPGANQAKLLEKHHLEGVKRVIISRETDDGGSSFVKGVRERLRKLKFTGFVSDIRWAQDQKDPSDLFCLDPDSFKAIVQQQLDVLGRLVGCAEDGFRTYKPAGFRLPFPFDELNAITRGGLPIGRTVVFAGAPGANKTGLLVYLAHYWERKGAAVGYICADEHVRDVRTRYGQILGYDRDTLEQENPGIRNLAADACRGRTLFLFSPFSEVDGGFNETDTFDDAGDDDSELALEDFAVLLRLQADGRPRVLVIDSLQKVPCRAAEGFDTDKQKIDAKMRMCKRIAASGVLVVVISEMNRGGYKDGNRASNTNVLAASKESGAIEYEASFLAGLVPCKDNDLHVDLVVAKNRLGGKGLELRLARDPARCTYTVVGGDAQSRKIDAAARDEEELRDAILEAIRTGAFTSKESLAKAVGRNKSHVSVLVDLLIERGIVVKPKTGPFAIAPEWHPEDTRH